MKFYYDVKGQNKKFNSTHAGRTRSNVFPFAIASLSLLLLLFANGACRAERTKKDPQQPHDCLVLYAKQQFCQLLFFCFVTISSIGFSLSHFQSHTHGHIAMQNCELYLFAEMPVAYTKKEVIFAFFCRSTVSTHTHDWCCCYCFSATLRDGRHSGNTRKPITCTWAKASQYLI